MSRNRAEPYALAHALAYARMGWPVLPLRAGAKLPATAHGYKDATTDPDTIRQWFEATPRAGVGIHSGPACLLALDVDDKDGKTGSAQLEALEAAHGPIPPTLVQRTPSGGRHVLLRLPDGVVLGNGRLPGAPHIDIRAHCGYIAATPTRLAGGVYAFDGWDATTGEAPHIADAPPWLLALLMKGNEVPHAGSTLPAPGGDLAPDMTPAETLQELRSALAFLVEKGATDPANYADWVQQGQRLKSAGTAGFEVWAEFSAKAPTFDPEECAQKWGTFKPDRTGYAAIFKQAQAAGWANPRSKSAQVASASEKQRTPGGQFALYTAQGVGSATAAGVYFIGVDKDGNEKAPLWVCAPLRVIAKTRGAKSSDWGRLLEWRDADGRPHRWAVPAELLAGDGLDVRRELMRMGLEISPGRAGRDLLGTYIQGWDVTERARCVERLGWHGAVYVLPDEAIGAEAEAVVFQSSAAVEPAYAQAGTAAHWRDGVATLAAGNSRMVFAIACAFAPALAALVGEDSGGFHLRGKSSSGKSTALALAASVWGNPASFTRLWRTTTNGLEGLAAVHSDCVLILDELSQMDPREAGDAAYLLANGQGKTRASRAGMARQPARWRLLFLSAGEESLAAMMGRAGKRSNAGQEVRLADIEADAGAGLGAFETLHDHPTGAALSLALKDGAAQHHGAVGVEWLRRVVADRADLAEKAGELVREFVAEHTRPDSPGQVLRVARRFGLVAAAGALATGYGLTGWKGCEAFEAVGKCFTAWLDGFGGDGNREDRALLAQVRAFFEVHGASRFQWLGEDDECAGLPGADPRLVNRAGFVRDVDGARQFLVLPEVFKREVCQGFEAKAAAQVLVKAGVIQPGKDGKASRSTRLPGIPAARVYVFTGKVWEGSEA